MTGTGPKRGSRDTGLLFHVRPVSFENAERSFLNFALFCPLPDVDKAMVLEHLQQAERHVAEGERHVARQKQIITELEDDGHDADAAIALLAQFEEMQAMHVADRDRLRAALAAMA